MTNNRRLINYPTMNFITKIYKLVFADKPRKLNYLVMSDYDELNSKLESTITKFLVDKGFTDNKEITINVSIDNIQHKVNLDLPKILTHKIKQLQLKKPKSSFGTDYNKGISAAIKIISNHAQPIS